MKYLIDGQREIARKFYEKWDIQYVSRPEHTLVESILSLWSEQLLRLLHLREYDSPGCKEISINVVGIGLP